jgi:beta-galactosidase
LGPRLWDGVDDPYLHTVRTEVWDGNELADVVIVPLGLRAVRVDPETGFWLNGRPYTLRGVNRHQDRLHQGWALSDADHAEDITLIAGMGANAVRLAHYPQARAVYELCDRLGLIVWSEIPIVNRIGASEAFRENARAQLGEMIRQHYNHPSVAFWGIGNEVTLDRTGPDPNPLLAELAGLVRAEDPNRIDAIAHCCTDESGPETRHTTAVGFNNYFGWYEGEAQDLGLWADALHAARPELPVLITEYGAGASVLHHAEPPRRPRHDGRRHPEEYQSAVHEAAWDAIRSRPFLAGSFVWNAFDFASDARDEGDTPGRNDKGLVTFDRQTTKDAYWFYKAAWSREPVVYIAGRRFNPRPWLAFPVKVYANLSPLRLTVNGRPAGTVEAGGPVFLWPDVTMRQGRNVVEVEGERGGVTYRDVVTWTVVRADRLALPLSLARSP